MNRFTRRLFLALSSTVLAGLMGVSAHAETKNKLIGVVELYTSQGCSSCPPADAGLKQFIERDDVLALSFHVDYWDYLGWKDTLASPENSARQRDYRESFQSRNVYTPQAVINGREHEVGSRVASIKQKLEDHAAAGNGLTVPINLSHHKGRVNISVDGGDVPEGLDVKLVLVYYKDATTVDIKRGENTGREITYRNTVIQAQTLGMWDGKEMQVEMPIEDITAKGADGCAVLLQVALPSGAPGPILGAAVLSSTGA